VLIAPLSNQFPRAGVQKKERIAGEVGTNLETIEASAQTVAVAAASAPLTLDPEDLREVIAAYHKCVCWS
jgi:hypothetical protein